MSQLRVEERDVSFLGLVCALRGIGIRCISFVLLSPWALRHLDLVEKFIHRVHFEAVGAHVHGISCVVFFLTYNSKIGWCCSNSAVDVQVWIMARPGAVGLGHNNNHHNNHHNNMNNGGGGAHANHAVSTLDDVDLSALKVRWKEEWLVHWVALVSGGSVVFQDPSGVFDLIEVVGTGKHHRLWPYSQESFFGLFTSLILDFFIID